MHLTPLASRAALHLVLTMALVLAGTPLGAVNASPDFAILKTRNGAQRSDADGGHPTSEVDGALLHAEDLLVDDGGAAPLAVLPPLPATWTPATWTTLDPLARPRATPAPSRPTARDRAPPRV